MPHPLYHFLNEITSPPLLHLLRMNVSNLTLKHAAVALFLQLNFKGTFPAMGKLNRCFFFVLYRLLIKTENCQRRASLNAQKYNFGVKLTSEVENTPFGFEKKLSFLSGKSQFPRKWS